MKPAPFDYRAPERLDDAIALLATSANAKIIAGGQSLIPMLNFRLVTPDLLVDITRIPELRGIKAKGKGLSIGALTRHYEVETSPLVKERFPVISEAMRHVAHIAIRNKGTIGGSLSHADPAAEWPMLAVLLDAQIHLQGPEGIRILAARDFLRGALTANLQSNEVLVNVDFPALPSNTVFVFDEFARRTGDFALCAVADTLSLGGGLLTGGKKIVDVRIALMGVDETALRISAAENLIKGQKNIDDELIERAATLVRDSIHPNGDLHASADYRRHLAYAMSKRSLQRAWARLRATVEA